MLEQIDRLIRDEQAARDQDVPLTRDELDEAVERLTEALSI